MEILTLHAADPWQGAGTALIAAARTVAGAIGADRLWLITTNDNLDALRFYQRRGLRLVRLHAGAVDRSRAALKPSIPGSACPASRSATSWSSRWRSAMSVLP